MGGRLRLGSVLLAVSLVAVLVDLPRASSHILYIFALIAIQIIAVMSLNLLMGYAGQVSLGQAAFVGLGAYAVAQFVEWGMPFPLTLIAGAFTAALVTAIVGLPSLRIRGMHLAATTLAFGVLAERYIFERPWAKASTMGVIVDRPQLIKSDRSFLVVALMCLLIVVALDATLRRSRLGRAFYAVRDREDIAAARGVPVGVTKLLAYGICGLYAGVAGGLWAYLVERVAASPFSVWNSLGYIAAAVVGGLGSWTGAVVAAVLFFGLPELLPSGVATYSPLAGAILLALVPVLWPEGLGRILNLPLLGRQRRLGRPRQPEAVAAIEGPAVSRAPAAIGNGEAERRLGQATRSVALSVPVRTLLVSRDIQVAFGGLEVLKGVNLEVRRGELVGLIGPNGAGKTTFFNCVSGFVRPRGGEITYRGRDLLSLPAHVRPGLGIIRTFQQVGLCPPQTVWENALLAQYTLGAYGVLPGLVRTPGVVRVEREVARRAEAALEVVGISELANERVGTLPHGQQRLVEVAVALAAGPELLLLDEPAAGMGPEESNELGRRLADLHSRLGLTILIIEHHVPMVANLCTYIYVLNDGRVLAEGNPEQVQRDPGVVATYLGEEAAPEAVKAGV